MVNIDAVKFGELVVDGKVYYSDMVVYWDGSLEFRKKSHIFGMQEFGTIMRKKPDSVVIGTGLVGVVKVAEGVMEEAEKKKVNIFVDVSHKAVDIFNGLVSTRKRAVAVIHTTC